MGELSIYHWLIVLLVIILFFGARKIPELMRGLGEGTRHFRDAINGVPKDAPKEKSDSEQK
jgi:sec-independent protein translocase protein TatA